MTMSIVTFHSIDIDPYAFNTGDEDEYRGHFFSNKAPGQSLLGVPIYAGFRTVLDIPPLRRVVTGMEQNAGWNLALADASCVVYNARDVCRFPPRRLDFALAQYIESVSTVAVPSVLLLLLFLWFTGYFSTSLLNRVVLTASLGLATIILPYSGNLYSHVPAAALEFAAFVVLYASRRRPLNDSTTALFFLRSPGTSSFLAGFLAGLGIVFEYPAVLIAGAIGLYAVATRFAGSESSTYGDRFRAAGLEALRFGFGAVPAVAIVMAYNYAAYHDPLTTGYSCYEVKFQEECSGIAGFTLPPKANAILQMSAGRYRGLFFLSPFLLLAFPGYLLWWLRRRNERGVVLTFLLIPVSFFFAISCYFGWYGGQVVGARYIIPILPFLALPVLFVLDGLRDAWTRGAAYVLIAISAINVWVETIGGRQFGWTSSSPSDPMSDPLFNWNFPQLFQGQVPLNLGHFLGLTGWRTLLPLAFLLTAWSLAMFAGVSSPSLARMPSVTPEPST